MKNLIRLFAVLMLLVCKAALADVTFVHTDVLGSPVAETNSAGQLVRLSHYKPFGEELEQKKDDVAYTGHKYDAALGLIYMQARYYDPVIGRFYSNDPIGFRDVHSFNRYAYANNNPYKYKDPDGKNPICFTPWTALACVGVAAAGYGVYKWTGDVQELGDAKLQELEAEEKRQQAYIDCIRSGGRNCSNISNSESELNEKRKQLLQKAGEAAESGCIVGTSCGGPLPTTTNDNAANGITSIFSWLFGDDDDDDTEQEPPQEQKEEKNE